MDSLNSNWITEGLIDFEYKKFILLAYLKDVSKNFNEQKLYPFLSDLLHHYRNLSDLKEKKIFVSNQFPSTLSKIDFEKFKLRYEKIVTDDDCMKEVENILDFAIPLMNEHLQEGKELYEFVETQISISPIGIHPLNKDFGYMLLTDGKKKEVMAYEYEVTLFESAEEKYRGIHTTYISNYNLSLTNSFENIKSDLQKTFQKFSNPATFAIECNMVFPLKETLLPIAKRSLVRYIFSNKKQ